MKVLNYFRQHNQKVTVKAENNGGGKSEDIEIVRIMEQHLTHLSRYKRCIRRGMLYNRIAKLSTTDRVKLQLWELLRQKLNGTRKDGRLERLNRIARLFCPFVLTMKKRPPYSFPRNRIRNGNCLPIFSGGLTCLPLK